MSILDEQYWNERHEKADTPWKIDVASPALTQYIDQIEDRTKSILIPGAGHYFEAAYLLEKGFTDITICDISHFAIEKIKSALPESPAIKYYTGDFFELEGSFDLILEQTFFCALNTDLRSQYLDKMVELLSQNGTLAGLLFASHFKKDGPPFGGDIEEYKTLFGKKLYILSIDMCYNSIVPRQGNELFFICKKI